MVMKKRNIEIKRIKPHPADQYIRLIQYVYAIFSTMKSSDLGLYSGIIRRRGLVLLISIEPIRRMSRQHT